MALLGASSNAVQQEVDSRAVIGRTMESGVPASEALLSFTEAVIGSSEELEVSRESLMGAVGAAGFVEAAGVVAIFSALVRVADATGIPLDESLRAATAESREALGLNSFSGAANTPTI